MRLWTLFFAPAVAGLAYLAAPKPHVDIPVPRLGPSLIAWHDGPAPDLTAKHGLAKPWDARMAHYSHTAWDPVARFAKPPTLAALRALADDVMTFRMYTGYTNHRLDVQWQRFEETPERVIARYAGPIAGRDCRHGVIYQWYPVHLVIWADRKTGDVRWGSSQGHSEEWPADVDPVQSLTPELRAYFDLSPRRGR